MRAEIAVRGKGGKLRPPILSPQIISTGILPLTHCDKKLSGVARAHLNKEVEMESWKETKCNEECGDIESLVC